MLIVGGNNKIRYHNEAQLLFQNVVMIVCLDVHIDIGSSGYWSSEGCNTSRNHTDFVCRCNHLSFFAVLIVS